MTEIIKANENDIALIADLARNSWKTAYKDILSRDQIEYMLGQMYSPSEISGQMKQNDYYYYIIFENEIPAGFMGFEFHFEPKTTKLHRLYLLDEFRGKGLGRTALTFLSSVAKEAGERSIILNVNKHNPARSMYEACGYHIYDEGVFDIGSGYVMDDYLLRYEF